MPAEGVALSPAEELLTLSEMERLVSLFASHGVRKVRLTGGEPLVRRDIVDIVGEIVQVSLECSIVSSPSPPASLCAVSGIEAVQMTTNGVTLSHKLPQLKDAGLSGVNISLDTLVPAKFEFITRRRGLEKVLRGIDEAVAIGIGSVKVTTFY